MNRNELTITSHIADKATLTAHPVRVTSKHFGGVVQSVLLTIKDGVNNEPSCHYLDMAQAAEVATWLMARLTMNMTPSEFAAFVANLGMSGRLNEQAD